MRVSPEITSIFEDYVRFLDDRRYEDWIDLFHDDSYYGVLTSRDHALGTNYVIVGERKAKLADRARAGAELDEYRKVHLLTAISPMEPGQAETGRAAKANFLLMKNGLPSFCGQYHAEFGRQGDRLKITKWLVLVDNEPIPDTVFLPI